MTRVWSIPNDAAPCRVCGATHARPHSNKYGICDGCFTAFAYRNERADLNDDSFLTQLANQLSLDIKRHRRFGIIGRCEAVSAWTHGGGYQCKGKAVAFRDGHLVCHSHAAADDPKWTGTPPADPYAIFADNLASVCVADERFLAAVESALKRARTKDAA